jgi:dolichyl-phosphate-mannose--protein O-mannosyl transferase
MTEVMKYVWKYIKALGFISALICMILGTDVSKLEESTTVGILLYCAVLGTLIIWSFYYTYDFIKAFHKE